MASVWNHAAFGQGLAAQQKGALDALVPDMPQSSASEGEQLDAQQVRSFLAARPGLEPAGFPERGLRAEGPAT
ncbi:DUF4172 domain-containing protein [Deinococcus aerolatus]|uniref:DUF4172 domain-containing protein n=1 Tax=Deinococcus aerolatus TaxID=522487 RepID=UPI0027E412AD|nr:DUF4172 domain-containing protein [Deinococcus aerolatus]